MKANSSKQGILQRNVNNVENLQLIKVILSSSQGRVNTRERQWAI